MQLLFFLPAVSVSPVVLGPITLQSFPPLTNLSWLFHTCFTHFTIVLPLTLYALSLTPLFSQTTRPSTIFLFLFISSPSLRNQFLPQAWPLHPLHSTHTHTHTYCQYGQVLLTFSPNHVIRETGIQTSPDHRTLGPVLNPAHTHLLNPTLMLVEVFWS